MGKSYSGESSLPATTASVIPNSGDAAQVFYDSANPSTNSLDDYSEQSRGYYGLIIFATIVICALALRIFISKSRLEGKAG
jgi:hypothetical protein